MQVFRALFLFPFKKTIGFTLFVEKGKGISPVKYKETEHYRITKYFLNNTANILSELL